MRATQHLDSLNTTCGAYSHLDPMQELCREYRSYGKRKGRAKYKVAAKLYREVVIYGNKNGLLI